MPGNPLDVKTAHHLAVAVEFAWGDPGHTARYLRWDDDPVPVTGVGTFDPCPELAVETAKQHGGVQDVPFSVVMRTDRPPFNTLLRPYAHAPVKVRVSEMDPKDADNTYRVAFRGVIQTSTRNVQGLQRLGRVDVAGWRLRLDVSLGVACLGSCVHVLGDQGCAVDLVPLMQTLTVSAVAGRTLTVPGLPAGVWRNGEAYFDGLPLMIAEQFAGSVKTLKPAPPEWAGQLVRFTPGCDKKIDGDCRTTYANEARHLALGYKMPSYHPSFESP